MTMRMEKKEIYRAIGEMAYAVAKAQKGLTSTEKIAFFKIVEEELDYDAWAAQSRFELLEEVTHPTIEHAYNEAINELKKYKQHFTPELQIKAVKVLERVAESFLGTSEAQQFIIDRFKKDIKSL